MKLQAKDPFTLRGSLKTWWHG